MKYKITWDEFHSLCKALDKKIDRIKYDNVFPVPKNALYVAEYLDLSILNDPFYITNRTLIIDDLIDSGKTLSNFPDNDKAVLFVKNNNEDKVNYYVEKKDCLIQFPWEKEDDISDSIIRQLEYIGEDPTREGLLETPNRVIKSWDKLYGGYKEKVEDILKTFHEGSCDEMVILKDISFYSTCEHHLLPFFGQVHIGYIPDKKVLGVSKLARVVEIFARRMQIQERMTAQICDSIMKWLEPKGCIVITEAQHFCMQARGVEKQKSKMITSAIRGVFKDKDSGAREEFMRFIK